MLPSCKPWIWVIAAIVVAPLLGISVLEKRRGGGDGIVNLPGMANAQTSSGIPTPMTTTQNRTCRVGYELGDLSNGLTFHLPSNMPRAVATFSYGNTTLPSAVIEGVMRIEERFLRRVREESIREIGLLLVDGTGGFLNILIVLGEDQSACKIYIE